MTEPNVYSGNNANYLFPIPESLKLNHATVNLGG